MSSAPLDNPSGAYKHAPPGVAGDVDAPVTGHVLMRGGFYSVLWAPVAAVALEVVAPFMAALGLVVGVGAWWFGRRTRGTKR